MGSFLTIAIRNLVQARRRTLLLGLAIMVVTSLLVTLRAAGRSVSDRMIEAATTLSAGHINIAGFYKFRRKGINAIVAERDRVKAIAAKVVPEAVSIIDRHRGWGRVVSRESSINVGMNGLNVADEAPFFASLRPAPEKDYREGGAATATGDFQRLKEPNTVLLFSSQAKKLGVGVGDTVTYVTEASGGQTNTVDLTVIGVASDIGFMSNWSIFVPRQTVLDLFRLDANTTGAVMVYLPDIEQSTAVMGRLREAYKAAGFEVMEHDPNPFFMKFDKVGGEDWLGQRLDLTIWSDEISFILWITTAFDMVTFFVMGILALIIGGGIANSMWMAVRERTKEIGTMRAIGLFRTDVALLFVMEATLLGLVFALAGGLLGAGIVTMINSLKIPIDGGAAVFLMANTAHLTLRGGQIVLTVVVFGVIAGVAALFPALKAARLNPVEALMRAK